ncbi:MAG: three-Cys-motif partner protein TcmP [Armatimonadota bacterium]
MTANTWWGAPSRQSQVKTGIVVEYFTQWARVMAGNAREHAHWPDEMAYVDLFAGRGFYGDDTPSTPLRVIQAATSLPEVRERIRIWLNDAHRGYYEQLQRAVDSLDATALLSRRPRVTNLEVSPEMVRDRITPRPATLFFLDPWGYKGLSLELVRRAVTAQGSECILFFNFNRIYMGVDNPCVEAHMNSLFGEERFREMMPIFHDMERGEREEFLMTQARLALQEAGADFVLNFRFLNDSGGRTSHYIIHVTEGELGDDIMRGVMKNHGTPTADGIAEFMYDPNRDGQTRMTLFDGHGELGNQIYTLLAGESFLSMREIYRRYRDRSASRKGITPSDVKEALKALELDQKIEANPPASQRPWRNGQPTFSDDVRVSFPVQKERPNGRLED